MAHADALAALAAHYRAMPPVASMDVAVAGYDGARLRLQAPLARHVNDKGCAFGGSLVSLMTLAGWGLVTLRLDEAGLAAEVFVADSEVRYLRPLFADLAAEAEFDEGVDWQATLAALRGRGRARVGVRARVRLPDDGVAAEARARYVAIAKG
ncbi:MAG: YiiD C-terminal domain-containing protein [Lysobacteraceae bacterium]